MKALFTGTGTSFGIPRIGCNCETCISNDPRDNRLRSSILLTVRGKKILIDIGHDFRQQALRYGITRLDAILITHSHADHILGVDDLRALNVLSADTIPIYASAESLHTIKQVFFYCFTGDNSPSSLPVFEMRTFDDEPFEFEGISIIPVRVLHGSTITHGFRIGNFAYIVDAKQIPEQSVKLLKGVDTLVLNALRFRPHAVHFSVGEALSNLAALSPRRAFLTHMGHDILHARDSKKLPQGVEYAYDGLEIEIEGA